MTTVVVSGVIANKPFNGGEAWVRLNWILGLKKLGFQVYFVEQINHNTCIDEAGAVTIFENCTNLAYFTEIIEQFRMTGSAVLIYENGEQTYGLTYDELEDIAETAELLVNISGHLTLEPLLRRLRRKAYIDYRTENPC
jgi:hypothetical protein